jgi:hypothetical protein
MSFDIFGAVAGVLTQGPSRADDPFTVLRNQLVSARSAPCASSLHHGFVGQSHQICFKSRAKQIVEAPTLGKNCLPEISLRV